MIISNKLTRLYYQLCYDFNVKYNEFLMLLRLQKIDEALQVKPSLIIINSKIERIQMVLDIFPPSLLPKYDRTEGYEIGRVTRTMLDRLVESVRELKDENGIDRYSNNGMTDERKIPQQRAREAAEAWGEGYLPLTDFLEKCIENKVRTVGSCSGHLDKDRRFENSYVLFDASDYKSILIADNAMRNKLGDEIALWKVSDDSDRVLLGIYSSMEKREEFYEESKEFLEKIDERDFSKVSETLEELRDFMRHDDRKIRINYDIQRELYIISIDDNVEVLTEEQVQERILQEPTIEDNEEER